MTATDNTPTGADMLADALVKNGLETVFAIPGVQLDWLMEALRARGDALQVIVPRHEQTTTYMADGYYRASGKPGMAMVVPGPGLLNAGAGLATAYAANAKVLLLVGDIHSTAVGKGYGLLHEIKHQDAVVAALTKWNRHIDDPALIGVSVATAFRQMHAGRPRPVGLAISHDLLESRVTAPNAAVVPGADALPAVVPDPAVLDQIARVIDGARFPILYVGGGVLAANASGVLRQFAERIGIPVVMSDNGRGALSSRHPLALNAIGGRAVFRHADVAVVLGSRFMDSMFPNPAWDAEGTQLIFINVDAADMTPPRRASLALQADARLALEGLLERVRPRQILATDDAANVQRWAQEQLDRIAPQADYIRALRAALPDDGIFVNEMTQVGYLARAAFPVYGPHTYVGPTYQGALGYGFPTALGAAVGGGGRRVLSITGDGGFGWNLQELATARKYDLPVTLVVFNDGYFGNVRAIQHRLFGADCEVAVKLENPDFLKLADAFRIPAVQVDSPDALQSAATESLNERGPVLIEVRVGEMPSPWAMFGLRPLPGITIPDPGWDPLV